MPSLLTRRATERASARLSPATKREDRRRATPEVSIQRRKWACRERKCKSSRTPSRIQRFSQGPGLQYCFSNSATLRCPHGLKLRIVAQVVHSVEEPEP